MTTNFYVILAVLLALMLAPIPLILFGVRWYYAIVPWLVLVAVVALFFWVMRDVEIG